MKDKGACLFYNWQTCLFYNWHLCWQPQQASQWPGMWTHPLIPPVRSDVARAGKGNLPCCCFSCIHSADGLRALVFEVVSLTAFIKHKAGLKMPKEITNLDSLALNSNGQLTRSLMQYPFSFLSYTLFFFNSLFLHFYIKQIATT